MSILSNITVKLFLIAVRFDAYIQLWPRCVLYPEHQEGTHTCTGRTCKLMQKNPKLIFELRTLATLLPALPQFNPFNGNIFKMNIGNMHINLLHISFWPNVFFFSDHSERKIFWCFPSTVECPSAAACKEILLVILVLNKPSKWCAVQVLPLLHFLGHMHPSNEIQLNLVPVVHIFDQWLNLEICLKKSWHPSNKQILKKVYLSFEFWLSIKIERINEWCTDSTVTLRFRFDFSFLVIFWLEI